MGRSSDYRPVWDSGVTRWLEYYMNSGISQWLEHYGIVGQLSG